MNPAQHGLTSAEIVAPSWPALTQTLIAGHDLTSAQTEWAIRQTVDGRADAVRLAGFLTALQAKGPAAGELHGVVRALLASAVRVPMVRPCADIAGTGGDGTGAVNLSTVAAIIAAGAGITVLKHGGRAASSHSAGSADLAEAWGIALDTSPEMAGRRAIRDGFSYLFAPRFNPGLRHAVDVRRGLGVPTVFNIAAPLINPAAPTQQVIGVAQPEWGPLVAAVLQRLQRTGLVARGRDGLDKFTTTAPTDVWMVRPTSIEQVVVDAAQLGLRRAQLHELQGGRVAKNAFRARKVLDGERGAVRDAAVLNAAAVIVAADPGQGDLHDQLRAAIGRAEESIDSGAARTVLARATRQGASAGGPYR